MTLRSCTQGGAHCGDGAAIRCALGYYISTLRAFGLGGEFIMGISHRCQSGFRYGPSML